MTILFAGTTIEEFEPAGGTGGVNVTTNLDPYVDRGVYLNTTNTDKASVVMNAGSPEIGLVFRLAYTTTARRDILIVRDDSGAQVMRMDGGTGANTVQIYSHTNALLFTGAASIPGGLITMHLNAQNDAGGFCQIVRDGVTILDYSGAIGGGRIPKKIEFNSLNATYISAVVVVDHSPTGIRFVGDNMRVVDDNTFATPGGTGATGVLGDTAGTNDLNFLASNADGQKFSYSSAMIAKPSGHEVLGVKVNARVTSLNGHSARIYGEVGTTEYDQAIQPVQNSYHSIDHYFEVDPSTGIAFADLDAAEAMKVGIKSVAV